MNYHSYLAANSHSSDEVLEDWRWLIGSQLQLWHVTVMGDALLRNVDDNSIHLLDTMNGSVKRIADSAAAFDVAIASTGNFENWLMPHVVDGQRAMGKRPTENECLSFSHPPALGGQVLPDNIDSCSIPVHFSIAGQIHQQIKDLPPGTPVGKIEIVPAKGTRKRPWWKFW